MTDHLLFVTGKLAEKSLARVLADIAPGRYTYEIRVLGVTVAALLTTDLIARRLGEVGRATKVILPGRCRGELAPLVARFGLPFERGPEELKDLPQFFGAAGKPRDLTQRDVKIFAEIVDAPNLDIDGVLARAARYAADGADVIDVGCLPDVPFPHLAETVQALKAAGYRVSVDSLQNEELLSGARAGADYLFSLSSETLWIADEVAATPILIGADPRNVESLYASIDAFAGRGRPFYADAILDPIHYGFTESIGRYVALRARHPDLAIMMGLGNLTELTHADTAGINAVLLGLCSELDVAAVLTTEVSQHCRRVVREVDLGARILRAAKAEDAPPRHIHEGLMALHERHPFPYSVAEIADFAREVKDDNFRIQVSAESVHVYNRHGLHSARDPYDLFPLLGVEADGGHAFYLGLELARAQIAWQLGKRYEQDAGLAWGVATDTAPEDKRHFAAERSTSQARKRRKRRDD
ncbi:MAG: dihydropteroate synthase [Gammaproteobacteria bacterium]|nr:dihydropteroate synthase [Gammaproteobacteria bacterium]MBI5616955.1 dihydropteroate synthase [Gammaproteobacteria bacterium]